MKTREFPNNPVLLCDADGVLFPSEEPAFEASVRVTNAFAREAGLPCRFEAGELRLASTGKNFRSTATRLAGEHGIALGTGFLDRYVEMEKREVTRHLERVLSPDPPIKEQLTKLARFFLLAVVSSSARSRLDACLAVTRLGELFADDLRFSAEDSLRVPASKPDPAIYEFAVERTGGSRRRHIAVEDAVPGVQSAVAAGVDVIGNLHYVPSAERDARRVELSAAGALEVVDSWPECVRWVVRAGDLARSA
jgi:beta-phosphoglucomutase-like phosphatase (HAD superfamily)